ncbi:MAG: FHA domain-containing protein, partial [Lachnospiraceae bacterium]|nr:FHA domain-containing protein [Lachnospiraceae bacterium]
MMHGEKGNSLIVIESGSQTTYYLDDRRVWNVGRASKDNVPDIRLHSTTASRKHGKFENIDGIWFYLDSNGKNGTVYNGKH